ncbi:MAG: 2Fe-2S iron-sulfur cluster binding domain-containing protein [Spirochaeta sp.]|nr:2Fe-2S iron-sulfur cluster binding domain-containing protein [Spirochaeta sp.]
MHKTTLRVNGKPYSLSIPAQMTLLEVLREELNLVGTKEGCGNGECGACTVIMDGRAVRSCLILGVEADGRGITTIEGIAESGELQLIQQAFIEEDAVQCGFCTPGFIMAIKAAIDNNPELNDEQMMEALGGHLCRCTGYETIFKAFKRVRQNAKQKE